MGICRIIEGTWIGLTFIGVDLIIYIKFLIVRLNK